ncbi:hypothetical protein Ddye_000850 [Dipteronia dyeriana]|uniref:SWIM-type domain-containing protein n=1 Tax=Dipteronia dyeriana TaxID=168575 RepID=A0AAE0CSY6_9ROSI|nr:hypothetical protein Ddye_000850 [Dipteronia dyeriana]
MDEGITQECVDCFERYQSKFDDQYFTVSELEPDQVSITKVYNNNEAKVKWIAFKYEKLVKSNPSIDVNGQEYSTEEVSQGSYLVFWVSEEGGILEGLHTIYWSGWLSLKGPFDGVLLSAVSLDTNSGLFPLAVCICGKETQDSWEWFLSSLKVYLNYLEGRNLTFISDRQNGVIAALEIHFPFAQRRYYARHIYADFKFTYKGDHYKKLFWRAARSSNIFDFKACMEEIALINPAAKNWLLDIHPQHWSRYSYDPVIRCDHITNNMTEAFNSMLSTHRVASYLDLLEFIRIIVMRKFNDIKEECSSWSSVLPPRVHIKILKHSKESRTLTMIATRNMVYELIGACGVYAVKLREYNCACGSWQVSGIPCCHAMATINH